MVLYLLNCSAGTLDTSIQHTKLPQNFKYKDIISVTSVLHGLVTVQTRKRAQYRLKCVQSRFPTCVKVNVQWLTLGIDLWIVDLLAANLPFQRSPLMLMIETCTYTIYTTIFILYEAQSLTHTHTYRIKLHTPLSMENVDDVDDSVFTWDQSRRNFATIKLKDIPELNVKYSCVCVCTNSLQVVLVFGVWFNMQIVA